MHFVSLFIFLSLSPFWLYLFLILFFNWWIMQLLPKSEKAVLCDSSPTVGSLACTTLLVSLLLLYAFLLLQHSLFLPWKMYFSLWHQFSILPWEHEDRKHWVLFCVGFGGFCFGFFFQLARLFHRNLPLFELLLPYIKLQGEKGDISSYLWNLNFILYFNFYTIQLLFLCCFFFFF